MTTISQAVETVLKTDAAGRIQMPPERREALLDEFERSGLSGAKFAKLAGVKYQTFAAWAARRRKQRGLTRLQAQPPIRCVGWRQSWRRPSRRWPPRTARSSSTFGPER